MGGGVVEPVGEAVEVGAGELPLERRGDLFVAAAEGEQPRFERIEVGEVVGGEHLALGDGGVALGLAGSGGAGARRGGHGARGCRTSWARPPGAPRRLRLSDGTRAPIAPGDVWVALGRIRQPAVGT